MTAPRDNAPTPRCACGHFESAHLEHGCTLCRCTMFGEIHVRTAFGELPKSEADALLLKRAAYWREQYRTGAPLPRREELL